MQIDDGNQNYPEKHLHCANMDLLLDLHFLWTQHKTILPSSHSFLISAPYGEDYTKLCPAQLVTPCELPRLLGI